MNFILATSLLNAIAIRASRVLLALFALDLGGQAIVVGFIAATFSAFPTVLSWPAGKLSDRYGSRWLLVIGAVICAAGMTIPFLSSTLPAIFAAAALCGVSFTLYSVPLQNLVGALSKPDERARNFSNMGLMVALSIFIGPLLAGISIDHQGHAVTCLYVALVSLTPALLFTFFGGALPRGSGGAKPARADHDQPAEPMQSASARRNAWRLLATGSLVQLGLDLFHFYMPVYGHQVGLSATAIGMVMASFAVAAFVVRTILPRMIARLGAEIVLAGSFYVGAISFFLVPYFSNVYALALVTFLFGLGMGCSQPITTMLTYDRSAKGKSGEALGLRMTVNHLTRTIGPVVFGAIGSAFGLFTVFWITAAFMTSGGVLAQTDRQHKGAQTIA